MVYLDEAVSELRSLYHEPPHDEADKTYMTPFNVLMMKELFPEVQSLFSSWDTGLIHFVNSMLALIKKVEVQLAI